MPVNTVTSTVSDGVCRDGRARHRNRHQFRLEIRVRARSFLRGDFRVVDIPVRRLEMSFEGDASRRVATSRSAICIWLPTSGFEASCRGTQLVRLRTPAKNEGVAAIYCSLCWLWMREPRTEAWHHTSWMKMSLLSRIGELRMPGPSHWPRWSPVAWSSSKTKHYLSLNSTRSHRSPIHHSDAFAG